MRITLIANHITKKDARITFSSSLAVILVVVVVVVLCLTHQ